MGRKVPCGRCRACRIQRTSEWTLRILHEMENHDANVFITLTYNETNLPENNDLQPEELVLFWKRLRKALGGRKIKYYACGEYGEKYRRPHYHAIVFGLGIQEKSEIEEAWRKGYVQVGTVTEQSARYVASYIMDKDESIDRCKFEGKKVKPFQRSSLGLGKKWILEHQDKVLENMSIKRKGKEVGIPRYYMKVLADKVTVEKQNEKTTLHALDKELKLAEAGIGNMERALHDFEFRKQKSEELSFMAMRRKAGKKM